MIRLTIMIMGMLLAGCGTTTEYVEVKVPVPVRAEPPAALLAPWERPSCEGPCFVPLTDKRAVLGITEPGRQAVVQEVDEGRRRDRAWRAWALEPE